MDGDRVICVYEDRPECLNGLLLLLQSLRRHERGSNVVVYCPGLAAKIKRAIGPRRSEELRDRHCGIARGYTVKPSVLLELLAAGASQVLWIDTDIVLTDSLDSIPTLKQPGPLVVSEESYYISRSASLIRPAGWGKSARRCFPRGLNTCIVRVTQEHRQMLDTWESWMRESAYLTAQDLCWRERPPHVATDQDVLWSILGSSPFADLTLTFVRAGRDIAHCNGDSYSVLARLKNISHGLPALVHAQSEKPWQATGKRSLRSELSPYQFAARDYMNEPEFSPDWVHEFSTMARALLKLTRNNPNLAGIPHTLVAHMARLLRLFGNNNHI